MLADNSFAAGLKQSALESLHETWSELQWTSLGTYETE
jgi:hypothetical protein